MNKTIFFVSVLTLAFAGGCAASNGGGHSVGNSIVSDGASKKMADSDVKLDTKDVCSCADSKDAKAAKNCKCKAKDSKPACGAGDATCKK